MLSCGFCYCVYNKDEKCSLKNISINSFGSCEACLMPVIPPDYIDMLKKEILLREKLKEMDKEK